MRFKFQFLLLASIYIIGCSNKLSEEAKNNIQQASVNLNATGDNCYPSINKNDTNAAIIEAAAYSKKVNAQYFIEANERANAYIVMTTAINTLRANGFAATRTVAHPSLPQSDPYHFSSDALILNGNIYDIYQAFPIPGIPVASNVGPANGRAEITSDLIALGSNCNSTTNPPPMPPPSAAGTTIKAGDLTLNTNEKLQISGFHLIMQNDGNLVIYRTGGAPVWASNTSRTGQWCVNSCSMAFQGDGNLVLYRAGVAYWSSATHGPNDHSKVLIFNNSKPHLIIKDMYGSNLWSTPQL